MLNFLIKSSLNFAVSFCFFLGENKKFRFNKFCLLSTTIVGFLLVLIVCIVFVFLQVSFLYKVTQLNKPNLNLV